LEFEMLGQFGDVLNSGDVDALKTALQNLMVLFETQNRNYLELKEHIRKLKTPRRAMQIVKGDEVSVPGEESRPPSGGIVEDAFELLAATRIARKMHAKAAAEVEATLTAVLSQERMRRTRNASLADRNSEINAI
jgi:hypothetical protein